MKISIIVASYNYGQYLRETLDSILEQTYTDWEAIVVDDGSKDQSVDIIKEYVAKDSRIKFFRHPNGENRGLSQTVKLGVEKAQGEYIAFCESDDYWKTNALVRHLEVLEKYSEVAFSCSMVEMEGDDEERKAWYGKYWQKVGKSFPTDEEPVPADIYLEYSNPVPTFSCVMVRAELIKNCDFDPPVPAFLDWWLWRQIGRGRMMMFIREPLAYWRIHGESMIKKTTHMNELNETFIQQSHRWEHVTGDRGSEKVREVVEGKRSNYCLVQRDETSDYITWSLLGIVEWRRWRYPMMNELQRKALKYRILYNLCLGYAPGKIRRKRDQYCERLKHLESMLVYRIGKAR